MKLLFSLIAIMCICLLISCAGQSSAIKPPKVTTHAPAWIANHPSSSEYFVGIGSARVFSDLAQTQKEAQMKALQDISQQIEISVTSDVLLDDKHETKNNINTDTSMLHTKIKTFTQAVLQDWEISGTWQDPNGRYWCKIVLDKEKYYARVNKRINDAIAIACDALHASQYGSFSIRLQELYKGVCVLDEFLGNAMKATINGKEVILNNELPRRLQQLLSSIDIKPTVSNQTVGATSSLSDTLGVRVFIDGQPAPSIPVSWWSSSQLVPITAMPAKNNGIIPVLLKSLPASAGVVTVSATVDPGAITYELLKRKFILPAGSFTIKRQCPLIYPAADNQFCKQLIGRLTTSSAVQTSASRDEADFLIAAQCNPSGEPVMSMGIFCAKQLLNVMVTTKDGRHILDIMEEVSAADAQSGKRAQENAEKLALEKALNRIQSIY